LACLYTHPHPTYLIHDEFRSIFLYLISRRCCLRLRLENRAEKSEVSCGQRDFLEGEFLAVALAQLYQARSLAYCDV
jgi:hypothetical protein